MAILPIVEVPDPRLRLVSKPVEAVDDSVRQLVTDMIETMYDADGVGLAAPQVGVLKRVVVIDVGEGPFVMINPRVLETSGEQTGTEGCLSVPGKCGIVTRPEYAKVLAYNEDMEPVEIEGTELKARAMLHEIDHLDGKLYVEKVEGELQDVRPEEEEE